MVVPAKKRRVAKKKVETPKLSWGEPRLIKFYDSRKRKDSPSVDFLRFNGYDGYDQGFASKVDDFPNCCAFDVVNNFANNFLEDETFAVKCAGAALNLYHLMGASNTLAATNNLQTEPARILKALGFVEIAEVHNHSHASTVKLWLYR